MEDKFNFNLQDTKEVATTKALSSLDNKTEKYSTLLKELIETIYDIQSSGKLEKKYLDKLEEGIMASWEYVFYYHSGLYVAKLSYYFKEAEELLIKLSQHKDSKIRLRVVIILKARPSQRVLNEILANCINDKSKSVRLMVADVILDGNYINYVDLLEERILVEDDLAVIKTINDIMSLLKNGYCVHKFENNMYSVRIKFDRGSCSTPIFPQEELEKHTSKEYIAKMQQNQNKLFKKC